jgi:environmental stress-induced protein Ves
LRILRAADRRAVPWKNGGGITRDVAAFPDGPSPDSFDWRVSIAEIAANGPFSSFPGIDRQFAVLDGQVALTLDGKAMVLNPQSDVLSFRGEAAVHAEPVEDASTDLNVMIRRDRFAARMRRLAADSVSPSATVTILLAVEPLVVGEVRLEKLDAVLFESIAQTLPIEPAPAEFYLIQISALPLR